VVTHWPSWQVDVLQPTGWMMFGMTTPPWQSLSERQVEQPLFVQYDSLAQVLTWLHVP